MPSTFTWLDHSESDRREMQRVIELFKEADTRDELGIGQIRDAFSDLLFPGTSTIQTRARYFLLVPWIFREMEQRKIPSRRARSRGREFEVQLIDALENGGESSGVIGIVARADLKRLASSVYWHGLGVLGIRLIHGSTEDYYRSLDSFYRMNKTAPISESGEVLQQAPRNWHGGLPDAPDDLLESATMDLTRAEADYLRDRMRISIPNSMLSHVVDLGIETAVNFPWLYPAADDLPDHIQEWLRNAWNFSEAIHGASLLYNLMLAKKSERDDLITHYDYMLDEWSSEMRQGQDRFDAWDRRRFWEIAQSSNTRVSQPTKTFVDGWLDIALDESIRIQNDLSARNLIEHRERSLKRSQARLANRRALEMWSEAAGTAQLNYRWPITQRIANDIVSALQEPSDA